MSLPTLYNYTKKLLFVAAALTIALGANFAYGQWTDPSSTPPNPNVPAPINVGGDYQIKSGDLGATRVRSDQYCDASGANCVNTSSGGGMGGGGAAVGNGIFNNWPDAVVCEMGNGNVYSLDLYRETGSNIWYGDSGDGSDINILFNKTSGNYVGGNTDGGGGFVDCAGKNISDIAVDGQAVFLAWSQGPSGTTPSTATGPASAAGVGSSLIPPGFSTETLDTDDMRNMLINDSKVRADVSSQVLGDTWHMLGIYSDHANAQATIFSPTVILELGLDTRQAVCNMWADRRGYSGGAAEIVDWSYGGGSPNQFLRFNGASGNWQTEMTSNSPTISGYSWSTSYRLLSSLTCRYN